MKRKNGTGRPHIEAPCTDTLADGKQREMQIHAEAAEKATDDDRRFFEDHPNRTYRVRLLSQAERAQFEILDGVMKPLAEAPIAFAAIKQIAPFVRSRVVVFGPLGAVGQPLTDEQARGIWEGYADRHPWVREQEAKILAAMRQHGAQVFPEGRNA
ncbi:hypothetical protein [Methylobacterium sp. J-090]|uniref:hypothetical protein n=1 Tax=Methylobacterium sp. J-090 TaxID=2836666 RepID=UPI001FBAB1D9|nr:hypothetical protein [Methylobacterium sp. J-090]MCJ2080729.1 hypothetical protein [Methylobacterium sp. J-090]